MSENNQKKILLVTRPIAPPWDEASKNFAFNLAKNITDQEIYLLTNGLIDDFPQHIRQKPIYTSNAFSYIQKLRLIKHLRKMRNDFDILHYVFTPTKQNAFLIKNLLNCKMNKCARTIQSIATLREDLYSDKDLRNLIFGDLVVTYSDYAKNKLNLLGFNNVKRVYPGIDLAYFKPGPKDEKSATNYRLKTTDFIVTYPGEYTRLGATDDITSMLLRYADVFKQNSIKLIFACRLKNNDDIKKKEEVIEKLKKNNCLDQVIFIDTFSDMATLYNLSDAIIFPVRDMKGKFDIPLVLIEAMASEKPVIISDLPIFHEFATTDNSVKIKSGDVGQLKDAIINLWQNKPLAEKIGKNSRKFVQDHFDIKKIAEIYREIYAKL
jgi:glycosyltransferase involved in cell wall biosynthesis